MDQDLDEAQGDGTDTVAGNDGGNTVAGSDGEVAVEDQMVCDGENAADDQLVWWNDNEEGQWHWHDQSWWDWQHQPNWHGHGQSGWGWDRRSDWYCGCDTEQYDPYHWHYSRREPSSSPEGIEEPEAPLLLYAWSWLIRGLFVALAWDCVRDGFRMARRFF